MYYKYNSEYSNNPTKFNNIFCTMLKYALFSRRRS